MDVKGKELQLIALIIAVAVFFAKKAEAEDVAEKAKWIPAGQDASCITSCPTCTIYTHPIKACRDAMLLEYKTQHQQLVKQLQKKVKVQSEHDQFK